MIDLQPNEKMIFAGFTELLDNYTTIRDWCTGDIDETELQDVVVFIWQAMLSEVEK